MTSTNNQNLFDWAVKQDRRIAWVLTHNKKPVEMGWQQNPHKVGEGLESALVANDYANALGVNLGHSSLMGLDFDADDWPQQFADLAGVSVEEGKALLREQTYVVSPRMIADGTTPRLKVLVPFDQELAQAFADTGCKNKVTESKNGGIGIFGGTGVQFAVYGPYSQKVGDELIEGNYKPRNFNQIRPCGDVLRHAVLAMLKRVAESKSYKAKSPERRFASDSDIQDLDSAVKFLSASADDFSDSDSWFMVMCAIRDGGDSCLGLAHEFCSQMHNYDAREIDRRWDNGDFNPQPGGHTKATIFQLAAERGWKNPAKGRAPEYTQDSSERPSEGIEGDHSADLIDFKAWLSTLLEKDEWMRIPLATKEAKDRGLSLKESAIKELLQVAEHESRGISIKGRGRRRLKGVEIPALWEGILPAGRSACFVGLPKSNKTQILANMIGAWWAGETQYLGRKLHGDCPPVIIVGTDQFEQDWINSLKRAGLPGDVDPDMEITPVVELWSAEQGLALDSAGIEEIRQVAELNPGALIICDSVRKLVVAPLGIEEKDARLIGPLQSLELELAPYGVSIAYIHHAGKGRAGESPITSGAGGTALPGHVTNMVGLQKVTDRDDEHRVQVWVDGRLGRENKFYIDTSKDGFELLGDGADITRLENMRKAEGQLTEVQEEVLLALREVFVVENLPVTAEQLCSHIGGDYMKDGKAYLQRMNSKLRSLKNKLLADSDNQSTSTGRITLWTPVQLPATQGYDSF